MSAPAVECEHRSFWRRSRIIALIVGFLMLCCAAIASNWIVSLDPGSSGEAQSGTVTNLSITASASPAAANLLYPGGTGDVVISINNPNAFPVTVTQLKLPTNTTYANGYSNSALTTAVAGCAAATPSGVAWNFATATAGSVHTLTTPLVVGGNANLLVTLTNDASMAATAPAACAGVYLAMPSFTGVTASAGGSPVTTSPTTDAWTS